MVSRSLRSCSDLLSIASVLILVPRPGCNTALHKKRKSHPRQWVDAFKSCLQTAAFWKIQSLTRKCEDCSSPSYSFALLRFHRDWSEQCGLESSLHCRVGDFELIYGVYLLERTWTIHPLPWVGFPIFVQSLATHREHRGSQSNPTLGQHLNLKASILNTTLT